MNGPYPPQEPTEQESDMTTTTEAGSTASDEQKPKRNPPVYTDGLGEVLRSIRLYTGLSKVGMAVQMKVAVRTYQRVEAGDDEMPPGFLDTAQAIADRFDSEVAETIAVAEGMLGDSTGTVEIEVSGEPRNEWTRAVLGRAAFESGSITPILSGKAPTREAG
ncbi:hypothetical protein PBI_PIPEFISH_46 [Mycobacterium phage Pipefish]|uniref:Helix-turn-helix DNA binding protein n=1 Tax=Mycobacterium phage Pipefish TaxID=373413 RepID=Q19YV9_9CAUD|nr:HTH DNA binding protein [Mycobacterium phage Pipefish]ABD58543.1 hypothetical protein PBI_PIPEFISH_46 [Mycobacterium phage Pipefish]